MKFLTKLLVAYAALLNLLMLLWIVKLLHDTLRALDH